MPHYMDKEQNRFKMLIRRSTGRIDFNEIQGGYRWGGDVGIVRRSFSQPYETLLEIGCAMYDLSRPNLLAASLVAFEDPTHNIDQSYQDLVEMAINSGMRYDDEHPGSSPEQVLKLEENKFPTEFCSVFGIRLETIRLPFASYPDVGPGARCVYGTTKKSWTDRHNRCIGYLPSISDYKKMTIISDTIESGSCVTREFAIIVGIDAADWEAVVKYETNGNAEMMEKGMIPAAFRNREGIGNDSDAVYRTHGAGIDNSNAVTRRERLARMIPERISDVTHGEIQRVSTSRLSEVNRSTGLSEIEPDVQEVPAAVKEPKKVLISTGTGRMVAVASKYLEERFGLAIQSVVIVGLVGLVMMPIIVYVLIATVIVAVILVFMNARPRALDIEDTADTNREYHENHKKMIESTPKPAPSPGLVSKEAVASAQQFGNTALEIGNWFTSAFASQTKGHKKK